MSVIRHDTVLRQPEPPPPITDRPRRHGQSAFQPVDCPLSDARFHRLVAHLHRLGPRPLGELLLQLVGNHDDDRTALVVLLERYGQLDAGVVQAVGGDVFPPVIFTVANT